LSPNPIGDRAERLAQAIAERVVNLVLDAIDLNALIDRVDINRLVGKVGVDALVQQVDVEKIVERVDVDAIVKRVDLDAILKRVDIDAIVNNIDIDSLVRQTELGSIIAKSTTGVATEVLDVVRAQGVGLDDFCARWTNRLLRRPPESLPAGPQLLVAHTTPALTAGRPAVSGGSDRPVST
jgi:hypothetical protein